MALLDAPDLDSVSHANRDLAAQLLAAADLWLFVTTAARYADAVPWQALRAAVERDAAVVIVLNRVPAEAMAAVTEDARAMLADEGLAQAPLFAFPETGLLVDSGLPAALAAPLREWLFGLVADADRRAAVARRTLDGAVGELVGAVGLVAGPPPRRRTRLMSWLMPPPSLRAGRGPRDGVVRRRRPHAR